MLGTEINDTVQLYALMLEKRKILLFRYRLLRVHQRDFSCIAAINVVKGLISFGRNC